MNGDLRRHRIAGARAADAVERADQQVALARWIATGMTFTVELETERAREQARREADRRRQVEEEATMSMRVAGVAADVLRRDPRLVEETLARLISHGATELRRLDAIEQERVTAMAGRRLPQPRMR